MYGFLLRFVAAILVTKSYSVVHASSLDIEMCGSLLLMASDVFNAEIYPKTVNLV